MKTLTQASRFKKSHPQTLPHRKSSGFTLVELLVVITVIGTLAALSAPAFRSVTESTHLTSAAGILADHLNLARQTAITRNLPVEFRLYQVGSGANAPYRMVAVVIPDGGDTVPEWVSTPKLLPGSMIVDTANANAFSSILTPGSASQAPYSRSAEDGPEVPAAARNLPFIAFTFRPDGSTDLNPDPTEPWTLSVRSERATPAGDRPANNFITLLLDPVLGRVRPFQP